MIRALLVLLPCVALGQTVAPQEVNSPPPEAVEPTGCGRWKADGLGEGPIALGYVEADVATGRRACPRTEVGLGARFGAIIDTPAFYGSVVLDALVYGSVALSPKTEIFGTLEALHFDWAQNASLKSAPGIPGSPTLGTLTIGAMRQLYGTDRLLGGLSARLLLPTSFAIPNVRLIGAEVGSVTTWRPKDWVELHAYLGVDFSAGLGLGPPLPRVGGVVTAGLQLSPVSFAALVIDATGRLGLKSYFAPTVALRFRVYRVGIELAATLPLAGTDRHDLIAGARFNVRL